MTDKKVLIITYYWPPSGGSGVQRWLKFVKYLPHFGWTPYVCTPENPSFDIRDESLLKDIPAEAEVLKLPIWEPYDAFKSLSKFFTGKTKASKPSDFVSLHDSSFFQKLSTWIRANLFIPDPKVFWVRPTVKFLHDFIKDNNIKTVITTGPPHSIHLIGKKLKSKNPELHWIVDFRDPWSEWGFLESIRTSTWAMGIHKGMERNVLTQADSIITVTPSWQKMLERLSGRKVELLTNGFDEDDFKNIIHVRTENFVIRHIGVVNELCNPRPFMLALQSLCTSDQEFKNKVKVEFIGEVNLSFRKFVSERKVLQEVTVFVKSIPHEELLRQYGTASVLLLILTGYKNPESYLPGKLFEYIAAGLPVIGVGPTRGDAAAVLNSTQAGIMVDSDDTDGIANVIKQWYQQWSDSTAEKHGADISNYSRKRISGELIKLLK